jgi:hypothetical protein
MLGNINPYNYSIHGNSFKKLLSMFLTNLVNTGYPLGFLRYCSVLNIKGKGQNLANWL